uniref:Tryptophyllin-T3-1 n=1 Tax=Pithecopus azureus TaxID=2034991 RepID=TY31_PITAZ|nr:RecName: Full=Tryptophyllin-T3-1; Short=Pha-T3-1; AltName: Full=Tryptophyllin-9 [Pithecopus azureus]
QDKPFWPPPIYIM